MVGGLKGEGGVISFVPLKRLIGEGGLFENTAKLALKHTYQIRGMVNCNLTTRCS